MQLGRALPAARHGWGFHTPANNEGFYKPPHEELATPRTVDGKLPSKG